MKEPWFWSRDDLAARLAAAALSPAALAYAGVQRWRFANATARQAPIPVLCVGSAALGGVGKTPFAMLLARLLTERGLHAHFVTRGYRGALPGPVRVEPQTHDWTAVGDEALLLARAAPCWKAKDRLAGVRAAAQAGADAAILDDGFQNPSFAKTLSFLLVAPDDAAPERVFPAGRLREPPGDAMARADAVIEVTAAKKADMAPSADSIPRFRAWIEPLAQPPERALAFCGIARPRRFFETLERLGCAVVEAVEFPDHHRFGAVDLARLRAQARKTGAPLITTEKDFVRIPLAERDGIMTLPVVMRCDDEAALAVLATDAVKSFAARPA